MNFYEGATRFCLLKILVAVGEQSLDHCGVIVAFFVFSVFSSFIFSSRKQQALLF